MLFLLLLDKFCQGPISIIEHKNTIKENLLLIYQMQNENHQPWHCLAGWQEGLDW